MLARNASDDAIIISDFSEGVGGALGVVALGYLGWFLAPQKFRREGHMVGIIIAGILAIIALPYLSGTLLTKP